MPRGTPLSGLWRGKELIKNWLAKQQAPLCACGCGERIVLKPSHRHAGIPQFILGHHARARRGNYKGVDMWVAANTGKHHCQCGCGKQISLKPRHHATGIPRYFKKHHPKPQLGFGPEHPFFIKDRAKAKRPWQFPAWVKKLAIELYNHRCAWCGAFDLVDCDHIIPASLGGAPTVGNAQPLCPTCHRWKSGIEPTSRLGKTPQSRSRKRRGELQ
ncbi:HNH endonuclease [Stigmatella ashevillensis]|uniref:HNH endonuclease n=1 Tax=Stigmatella ashevillensis TaxID=2995309 RepID=UPI00358DB8DF